MLRQALIEEIMTSNNTEILMLRHHVIPVGQDVSALISSAISIRTTRSPCPTESDISYYAAADAE